MPLGYPAIGFGGRTSCSWVLLARGESKGLFYKKAKFKIKKKKSRLKFERKFRRKSEIIKNNFGCMPCISCAINAGERTSDSWLSVWCPCKVLDHQRSKEEF